MDVQTTTIERCLDKAAQHERASKNVYQPPEVTALEAKWAAYWFNLALHLEANPRDDLQVKRSASIPFKDAGDVQ